MTTSSRRILIFAAASISGLGLLGVLLLLFSRPPQLGRSLNRPATPTPRVVATVDDEPILFSEWHEAVALDRAMSGLVGQAAPSTEETLSRLLNERLVLRAAEKAEIPRVDRTRAEYWLADFLVSWNLEDAVLEGALAQVGLTRTDLLSDIVPRLLRVQRALETLPPGGDGETWLADLQREARVVLLENLSASLLPDIPTPTVVPEARSTPPPSRSTSAATTFSTGPRAGEQAPDFNLKAIDGTTIRLSDLVGRPVMLNFWAPWCVPCRQELPLLQAINSDSLVVLGLAVREPPETVVAFADDLQLTIPLLPDQNGQASEAYHVRGLPTSVFVDRTGAITARHVGPLDQGTLERLLGSLEIEFSISRPHP